MKKAILLASAMFILITPARSVMAFNPTHQFTDQTRNQESGLYDFGSRYYNPSTGRFVQPDPLQNYLATPELEKRSGQSLEQLLKNPQRLNAYSYAINNPVNVIDPTGEVSQELQESFNYVSNYIRNDENYWLIRDRDGNGPALNAIWNKCVEASTDDQGKVDNGLAFDTFYEVLRINRYDHDTLDESEEEFSQRLDNMPTALGGEWGGNKLNIDKLQHFAASARLTYHYGAKIAGLLGQFKEIKDGFRALFDKSHGGYAEFKQNDGGYSLGDITANRAGILWANEYQTSQIGPAEVINNLY